MYKVGDRVRINEYLIKYITCNDVEYKIIKIEDFLITLDRPFHGHVDIIHFDHVSYSIRHIRNNKLKKIMGNE